MATTTSKVSPVGSNYYKTSVTTNADGSLSSTTFRTDARGEGSVAVQTTTVDKNGGNKKQSFGEGATAAEQKAFADPNSPERQAYSQQVQSQNPYGTNPTAEQKQALNGAAGKQNQATTSDGTQTPAAASEDKNAFDQEKGTFKEGTRTEYGDVRYPRDLALEHQDCIKFSILEYIPSLASGGQNSQGDVSRLVEVKDGVPQIDRKPKGTITLPIPAGINDSNNVSWQEDTMDVLQKEFGSIAQGAISGGPDGAGPKVDGATRSFSEMVNDPSTAKGLSGMLAGLAVGSQRFQQRTSGTIFNNNLELLFNGPSLRSFSFTFKLSPREPDEAKDIMKIIRFFKQAMSVKRSKSTLLLKTPHTFAVSYLTSNKQHPYLNKFKECALTGFNVEYTPEGQYMTYMSSNINERSMISYNISLTFQELEPIFDDEYGDESPQNILNIGY